jgi:hypothetical protein
MTLGIFFVCKRLDTLNTNRIHLPKNSIFFCHMLFWGSAKPSFGWYKVTKISNEATTTKIMLPGAPKLGAKLIIMFPLVGCQKLHT